MALLDKLKKAATTAAKVTDFALQTTNPVYKAATAPLKKITVPASKPTVSSQQFITTPAVAAGAPVPQAYQTKSAFEGVSKPQVTNVSTPAANTASFLSTSNVTPASTVASERPITPAPQVLKVEEPQKAPLTAEEIQKGLFQKAFKQQYGNQLTDYEIDFLVNQKLSQTKKSEEAQKEAEVAAKLNQQQAAERTAAEQARLATEEERRKAQREVDLAAYRESLQKQAEQEIASARKSTNERSAIEGRLLGSAGNLTSSVGATRLGAIEEDFGRFEAATRARAAAEERAYKRELEGADEKELKAIRDQVDKLRTDELALQQDTAFKLMEAKQNARAAGDEAQQKMIQSALDQLSVKKLQSEFDKELTKAANDGFAYDKYGKKILDVEGKPLAISKSAMGEDLVKLGAGDQLYDPNTGKIVAAIPEKAETSPQSYREWQLSGSSMSYGDWLQQGKAPSATQSAAATYANRVQEANQVIKNIQGDVVSKLTDKFSFARSVPDRFKDPIIKQQEQAEQNFINAVLRRESGAAIAESEYKNAAKQYFPQAGDTKEVLDQKARNREIVLEGLLREAGPAAGQMQKQNDPLGILGGGNDPLGLSFNQPLSMGQKGSDAKKVAAAIGQFESGGNYKARGPVVTSGMYKGERALGKYQIMPGNLPGWSKEALGRVVSEQEFLNNPQIQDQIAEYKMAQHLAKYGTVEDVASVWFSGQPLAKAGNAKDVLGTSVPTYVKNVRSIYNKLG